jgi:hypothetical protein
VNGGRNRREFAARHWAAQTKIRRLAGPLPVEPQGARAQWGGAGMDFANMMRVLADVFFPARARAWPANQTALGVTGM